MEPILNKQEIADLLSAIRAGRVPLDLDDDKPQQNLKYTELNMFEAAHRRETNNKLTNFDIIIDNFSRNYAIALTNKLQRNFSLQRVALDSCSFQEFQAKRKNPGAIGLLNMLPLHNSALLVFDTRLSFSLIEIMLGASSAVSPLQLDRDLTTIELTILKTIISEACDNLSKAFKPVADLKTSLMKVEKNIRLVSIAEPESEVIVASFSLKVDDLTGEIDLLFPATSLEPMKDKLRDLLNVNIVTQDTWKESLESELRKCEATLVAQSGNISLSVDTILHMKVGDVIPLNYDPGSPLKLLIEDQTKFFARPGTSNGKKAVCITGIYQ